MSIQEDYITCSADGTLILKHINKQKKKLNCPQECRKKREAELYSQYFQPLAFWSAGGCSVDVCNTATQKAFRASVIE